MVCSGRGQNYDKLRVIECYFVLSGNSITFEIKLGGFLFLLLS